MGAGVIDVVRGLASATFGGTGSVLCMLQLANHGRHLIMTLLRMGGGPAGAGSLVREGTAFLAQVADAFLRALPARLGPSMAIGDAAALFASSDLYFPRPGHAFSALQSMIFTEEHAVEMFLAGGFRRAALERALRLARLLDGMLRAQPGFQWGHYLVIPPAFKVGAALLSAYVDESRSVPWETREQAGERVARVREYEVGARTVDSVLGALGRSYGLQPRRVARKFARMMLAAGIAVAMPPEEAEELLDVVEGEKPGFFWDALIAQADVAKAGSRGMLGAGL
ncbi:hypothetical protein DFJ74DRAFT_689445 [Hyaloraphidium curvatum]|nr:hypothetical protein DFJ74DRAFT_689445 [Hyaloraphidium curvatum]